MYTYFQVVLRLLIAHQSINHWESLSHNAYLYIQQQHSFIILLIMNIYAYWTWHCGETVNLKELSVYTKKKRANWLLVWDGFVQICREESPTYILCVGRCVYVELWVWVYVCGGGCMQIYQVLTFCYIYSLLIYTYKCVCVYIWMQTLLYNQIIFIPKKCNIFKFLQLSQMGIIGIFLNSRIQLTYCI